MAVPDWPTTFGYNMFTFPIDRWVGGIFYEHFHRLVASAVGLFTVIMAGWLLVVEPRRWVKYLAMVAGVMVVIQGVLGGLRVTLIKNEIGIFHGMLAQSFFVVLGILCIVTSPYFVSGRMFGGSFRPGLLRWGFLIFALGIFVQLGIAASMRHAHAGLSIPDFPLAYGEVLPATDPATISAINEVRLENHQMPTTAGLIWLQMVHRFVAYGLAIGAGILVWGVLRRADSPGWLRRGAIVLAVGILVQIGLGAWTIWSDKAADVATVHMATGAILLFFTARWAFRLFAIESVLRSDLEEFPEQFRSVGRQPVGIS